MADRLKIIGMATRVETLDRDEKGTHWSEWRLGATSDRMLSHQNAPVVLLSDAERAIQEAVEDKLDGILADLVSGQGFWTMTDDAGSVLRFYGAKSLPARLAERQFQRTAREAIERAELAAQTEEEEDPPRGRVLYSREPHDPPCPLCDLGTLGVVECPARDCPTLGRGQTEEDGTRA